MNTVMLAKLAALLKIPVITSASEPNGPNGPLRPEIHQSAPQAVYVPRKGEVNAWDNEDFVAAVRATDRRALIIAGVNASGDPGELASQAAIAHFVQGGVIPRRRTLCCPRPIARGNLPPPSTLSGASS